MNDGDEDDPLASQEEILTKQVFAACGTAAMGPALRCEHNFS